MKRSLTFVCMIVMILISAGCVGKPEKPAEPVRVLFIGDSTTSRNDIPGKFQKLAELGGYEVIVESSTKDFTSLATHTRLPQTVELLENQVWDIVILQENEAILLEPESLRQYSIPMIQKYMDWVNEMDGVILLYASIGFRDGLVEFKQFQHLNDYEKTQDAVDAAYMEIASELDLPVAPVGAVWRQVYASDPAFDLWQVDGMHVSPEGAYLAACVFYAAIFNQSPVDLPVSDEFEIDHAAIELIHAITAKVVLNDQDRFRLPLFRP
jgi:hypothetical protein